jgi:parallel beta helix pectate lyase-like protein
VNPLRDRRASRRRILTILTVLPPFVLAACTVAPAPSDQAESGRALIGQTVRTPTRLTVSDPPSIPPAQICGNASILNGPAAVPPGAVVVNVGDNIETLTANHPAGATFWLAPGIHRFSYSVVPRDGNTYIGRPGAIIDGGGTVNIAFREEFYGRKAKNVTLSHLTIQAFTSSTADQGSIYTGVGWKIANSTLKNHGYVALFAGPDNVIEDNCFDSNGQLGIGTFRFDDNTYNVTVDHNEFKNNNARNLQDCGCGGGMKWWTMNRGKFTNNWVHNNKGPGVWADTNNIEILFEGNFINDNDGEGIFYEISYNFMIRSNTIIRNALVKGATKNGNFPIGGVHISESGGVNIPGYQYGVSEIYHNFSRTTGTVWCCGKVEIGTRTPTARGMLLAMAILPIGRPRM